MTIRKFHRTVIKVVVLSEESYSATSLEQVVDDITQGDCSGEWEVTEQNILDGKECAEALMAQHSDPGFFQLTKEGDDDDDA